ncbi:zinc finger protein 723-like [Achroia grisella]|uniref:zinc finger protein 723-like n=1 Tax=Achroia grisella TaxID=688607 RepID=UPI0027D263AF|nr:zinc finger protein 723-like [Achroia grisella]
MNNTDTAYCRLCAEMKPNNKMTNLQLDEQKRVEIVGKLTRLNANMDLSDDLLPKTACFVCIHALDKAYEFVSSVEQAQIILNGIVLNQIKKEDSLSDSESYPYEFQDDVKYDENNVKLEADKGNSELNAGSSKNSRLGTVCLVNKTKKKRPRESIKNSLDAIPLAQLKLTWRDYSWTCAYCETQFQSVDELKIHSIQYHNCCNAFKCTDCNIRKLKLDSFVIHVKRHRKFLKLSCYNCYMRFSTPHEVNVHKSCHITSEYSCNGCNSMFESLDEMNQHTTSYYRDKRIREIPMMNDLSDNLTCVLCKKSFKHKGSLNTHLLIHTERKRDHTCEKCGKCFLNKQNLTGHMLLHNDNRPFKCEICKATFKTSGQLRNHVGVHDAQKPYACDQCGRCFRLQKQLSSHRIIHTDLLPYTCTYCNKGFRFKTILNQHVRLHTGVKPYSCEVCQRDFTNWPNYNKHMKRRHGTDMSKKKHTPDGVYPINPSTGEVIIYPETNSTLEWKKKMMMQRRPGRPKLNLKSEATDTVLSQPENLSMNVTVNDTV